MSEFATWLDVNIQEQKNFVLGFLCAVAAILLRSCGFIRSADAAPIAKLTFNFCFPALLFVKVAKAELKLELWRVALASLCVNGLLVLIVVGLSRCVSSSKGFRGQWMFCTMGGNIGFTYPIVLAAKHLHKSVFPSLVIWDLAANMEICFILNFAVAICYSPGGSDNERAKLADSSVETSETLSVPNQMVQVGHSTEVHANEAIQLQSETSAMDRSVLDEVRPESRSCPQGCHTELQTDSALPQEVTGSPDISVAAGVTSGPSPGVQTAATSCGARVCTRPALDRTQTRDVELGLKAISGSIEPSKHPARTTTTLVLKVMLGVLTNIPLFFQISGLCLNLSGVKLPRAADELLESIGQPFTVLFFIVIGMNLNWSTIRKRARSVSVIVPTRVLIHGLLMLIALVLPLLQEGYARKAALIALCCPMGGITMAYTLEYGFDSGLQAATMSVSNIISFAFLLIVINL